MSEQTLKPCPFCGGNDVHLESGNIEKNQGADGYEVACWNCDTYGSLKETEQEAIAAWNQRANAGQWIKVSERMPKVNTDRVWIVSHGHVYLADFRTWDDGREGSGFLFEDTVEGNDFDNVTQRMPCAALMTRCASWSASLDGSERGWG